MLIGPLGTNFNETSIEIHTFSFKKIHLKLSSGKWRPFCLGLNGNMYNVITPELTSPIETVHVLLVLRGLMPPPPYILLVCYWDVLLEWQRNEIWAANTSTFQVSLSHTDTDLEVYNQWAWGCTTPIPTQPSAVTLLSIISAVISIPKFRLVLKQSVLFKINSCLWINQWLCTHMRHPEKKQPNK